MKRQHSQSEGNQKRRVYSYIRFSTPEQKLGDSLRRQMEAAKEFAAKNGYVFDEHLRDEGLSGWSGKHRKEGALGVFLKKVEAGKVPSGSILFVEEIDRLSREEMVDALETVVFGLIKFGVSIATPTEIYDRESLNNNGIWRLIVKLQTAHEESQKRSERGGKTWSEKKRMAREEGRLVTSRGPRWLERVGNKWVEIPEAVATVRMIFREAARIGRSQLVKKLNAEAPWMPPGRKRGSKGKGWRMSYVRKILGSRTVLGEYQPFTKRGLGERVPDGEPILDYYPQIIGSAVFFATQKRLEQNKAMNKGGRTGSATNLFTNLVKCAYCGGPMVFRDRGSRPKGGQSLVCDNAMRGVQSPKCSPRSVRYAEVQETVLSNCRKLKPEEILPDDRERQRKCEDLRVLIDGRERERDDNERQMRNLTEQIGRAENPAVRSRFQNRIGELDAQNKTLAAQLDSDRALLGEAEKSRETFALWQRNLESLRKVIAPKEAIEARLRLQSHLKQFIAKIEIFADGYQPSAMEEADTDSEAQETAKSLAEYFEEQAREHGLDVLKSKKFHPFLKDLTKRRMSREGRFFRVHFRPKGGRIDLVPAGSLATGRKLVGKLGDERQLVHPNFELLWEHFQSKDLRKPKEGKKA